MKRLTFGTIASLMFIAFLDTANAQLVFTNVTGRARLIAQQKFALGPAVGVFWDYDGDGDLDIYQTHFARNDPGAGAVANILYQNDGNGRFRDVTKATGLADEDRSGWDAAIGDYDNDGDGDLFLFNANGNRLYANEGGGVFREVSRDAGFLGSGAGGLALADYDNDGYLDVFVGNDFALNMLFHNQGDGTFDQVLPGVGIPALRSNSLGVVWFDVDDDNDQDLFVVTHHNNGNHLYRNEGDGTFTEITREAGLNVAGNGVTAVAGDYDNDGDFDLYFTTGGWRPANNLYQNNGDGTFRDVTRTAGVKGQADGTGAVFADFDNDGFLDLYVAGQPNNLLYRNRGNGRFEDITQAVGGFGLSPRGGIAAGDIDSDGDVDLYVTSVNGRIALYRNEGTGNHWLHINLVGVQSNRDGIGARIHVAAGDLSMIRQVTSGSFLAKESITAEFGLAQNPVADTVEIRWPSGRVDVLKGVPGNQILTVEEGGRIISGLAVRPQGKQVTTFAKVKQTALYQNYPNPFNPETWIPYQLDQAATVTIEIHTVEGQLVRRLAVGRQTSGIYLSKERAAYWDGRNARGEAAPSGVYFYTIHADAFSEARKMVVVK